MIGIIDYGAGNLLSVKKAFEYIGARVKIIKELKEAKSLQKLVLPGVGAFEAAMIKLKEKNLDKFIYDWVMENKPFLGICLGMQLLFEKSEESVNAKGLGIYKGKVLKFKNNRCPQIGWNQIKIKRPVPLFDSIPDGSFLYFLHSYYVNPEEKDIEVSETEYGINYTSAICRGSIYAVQFHPEKSGNIGIRMIRNWVDI
jgi:glutamine amidotransferase